MFHERYASINRDLSRRLMRKYAGEVVHIDLGKITPIFKEVDTIIGRLREVYKGVTSGTYTSNDASTVQNEILSPMGNRLIDLTYELDDVMTSMSLGQDKNKKWSPGTAGHNLINTFDSKVKEAYDIHLKIQYDLGIKSSYGPRTQALMPLEANDDLEPGTERLIPFTVKDIT